MVAPTAAIVIPTLDPERAGELAMIAQETAGVPATVIIVADCDRRGGTIPTNAGFRAALALEAPYIVYLNDDVELEQDGWLKRLCEALELDPLYGIAAPSGPCRTGVQNSVGPGAEPGVFVVDKPLAWFCAVIKQATMREVGFFDTDMIHYACDSDYTRRAQVAGWLSVWVRDVYIDHHPGEPIGDWWKHDREQYKLKWWHYERRQRGEE